MRSISRALGAAVRAQGHLAEVHQRTLASLAARDIVQPELPPFDHDAVQYTGPSKQEVIDLRKRHLNPGMRVDRDLFDFEQVGRNSNLLLLQPSLPGTRIR